MQLARRCSLWNRLTCCCNLSPLRNKVDAGKWGIILDIHFTGSLGRDCCLFVKMVSNDFIDDQSPGHRTAYWARERVALLANTLPQKQ